MSDTIVRIGGKGDGLTADGRAFPLAAPGDVIEGDAILSGPHRVIPPCRHFPECGGCQLQHVDDAAYADFLVERIVSALAQHAISAPDMAAPHLSPPRTRRRAALRAERRGRQVLLGFNEGASYRIVDIAECHILHPALFALVAPLRRLLAGLMRDKRTATIHLTLADQGVDMLLEKVEAEGLASAEALTAFAESHRLARLSLDAGYGPEARWEPGPVTVTLSGTAVPLPPAAFLQATADGEAALVAAVLAGVGEARTVADLFAGLGTFALPLAARAKILAAEGARDSILALKSTGKVAADHRDLFRRPYAAAELGRFDAVVVDPPRAGMREQAPALAASGVRRIVHVSCNPATFARDARTLIDGGYRLERITPVGQFRWSTHVELVGMFSREPPLAGSR